MKTKITFPENNQKHRFKLNTAATAYFKGCSLQQSVWTALFLIIFLFSANSSWGQNASATWALTTNGNASVSGNVTATSIAIGSGIASPTYSTTNGISTTSWVNDAQTRQTNEYYEYNVSPNSGNSFNFTSLTGNHSASSGTWIVAAYYSLNDFSSETQIGTNTSTSSSSFSFTNLNIFVPNGKTLKIRIYAWESDGNNRNYRNRNIVISGTTCSLSAGTLSGTQEICSNGTTTLNSNVQGGTWSSNNTGVASINSSGVVTPVSAGTATMTYTVTGTGGCSNATATATRTVTVNPLPLAISISPASATICNGEIQSLVASGGVVTSSSVKTLGLSEFTTETVTTESTLGPNPFQSYYGGAKQQMLFRASELSALGISNGDIISSISFNMNEVGTRTLQNYVVKMKNTATTSFTTTFETGLTTVKTAEDITPVTGWNSLDLTSNFTYTGGNLIIEINFSNADSPTTSVNSAFFDSTTFVSTLFYRVDNASAAVVGGATTASFSYSQRNSIKFSVSRTEQGSIVWSPPSGLYSDVAATSAYSGSSATTVYAKPSATTPYTASVTSAAGCNSSKTVEVAVNPTSVAGTVSANQTLCSGQTPSAITLTGNTGTIQWQVSTDNSSFTNISGATASPLTSAQMGALTATRFYRAVVTSGVCSSVNSPVVTVTVSPTSVAGTVSANQTLCSGQTPSNIILTGNTGTIQWQVSTDNSSFTNISGATASPLTSAQMGALTATRFYRAVVTSGVCSSVNSPVVTVTVNLLPVVPTIVVTAPTCASAATNILSNYSESLTYTSSPSVLTVGAGGVITGGTNGTSYTITATNSSSCFATSASFTYNGGAILATPTLTVSNNQSICAGSSVNITASGASSYAWNNSAGTGASITVSPSNTTTYVVTGAGVNGCTNTASTTVTVNPIVAPSFTQVAAICSGAALNALPTISNNAITGTWSPALNNTTTTTYTFTPTVGQCASTTTMTITVNPIVTPSVTISASPSSTFCSGTSVTITATPTNGGTSPSYQWKLNGISIIGTNGPTYTSTTLTNGQIITVEMTSNAACGSTAVSNSITTIVNTPIGITAITPANNPIPTGQTTTTITATGVVGTGAVVSWYSGANQTGLLGTGLTSPAVGPGTYYAVVSGTCGNPIQLSTIISSINSWTGAVSTEWDNEDNWAEGVEPNGQTAVVISGTVANQPIISGVNNFANSITLLENAVLTIDTNGGIQVTNEITVANSAQFILNDKANLGQVNPNAVNSGIVKVRKKTRLMRRLDYVLWSSPTQGAQTLKQFSPETVDNRFYTYNSATNSYSVVSNVQTPFENGKGYLIRTPNNHSTSAAFWNVEFQGTPNNGTIVKQLPAPRSGNQNRYFLVGNPYASSISVLSFIEANAANITGITYLWRKTNGANISGYSVLQRNVNGTLSFNSNGEGQNPGNCIPSGQGFIVEMKEGASQVVFTNAMRVCDGFGILNRTMQETNNDQANDQLSLKFSHNNGQFTFATVGYFANASNEFEASYDAQDMGDGTFSVASALEDKRLVTQSRAAFSITDVVPLSLITPTAGAYQLSLDQVGGLFADGQNVYLRDNVTTTVHNLTEGAYDFTSDAGTFSTRFELLYQYGTLGVDNPVLTENQVVIFKTRANELSINTGNFVMDQVMIYDVNGRLLTEVKNINNTQALLKENFTTDVLLVKIKTQEGKTVTKKVLFPRTSLKKDVKVNANIQLAEDE